MRKTFLRVVVLVGTLLGMPLPRGTQLRELDRLQLTDRAQVILVARCTSIESRWNAGRTIISTYVGYQVEEVIKGAADGRRVVVKALGGTVGHITQMVVDGPTFHIGERSLLFLIGSDEPGTFRIQGLKQGKFRVYKDPRTGQTMVTQEAPGRTVLLPVGSRPARLAGKAQGGPRYSFPGSEPLKKVLMEIRGSLGSTSKH